MNLYMVKTIYQSNILALDNDYSSSCNDKSQPKKMHNCKFQYETTLADLKTLWEEICVSASIFYIVQKTGHILLRTASGSYVREAGRQTKYRWVSKFLKFSTG